MASAGVGEEALGSGLLTGRDTGDEGGDCGDKMTSGVGGAFLVR